MSPRARLIVIIVLLLLLALLALFLAHCSKPAALPEKVATANAVKPVSAAPAALLVTPPPVQEQLTPATIQVPTQIGAGATFQVTWTGPDNPGDYLTIVRRDAPAAAYQNYRETKHGAVLEMTAPIETGAWEVRYVALRSKTVLGRVPIAVDPVQATLTAPAEIVLGAPLAVHWTGPDNGGDYVNVVPMGASDDVVGSYAETAKGSPAKLIAPVQSGEAEIRYVSGQGRKIIVRRKIVVITPETSLSAPADVVAGAAFPVTWQGPKNAGDYITVVSKGTPDGQYRNYADTVKGSPLQLTAPPEAGEAEIRYMTGNHARVLARRPITITPAVITLEAAHEAVAGSVVSIVWSGPTNVGDYITVVPKTTPDGQYGNYTDTTKGTPLNVTVPIKSGAAEIRYMSGQGAKVLGRRALTILPAQIKITAPAEAAPGSTISVDWSGPNNVGDYLTLVSKTAKDGVSVRRVPTSRGSPAKLDVSKESGACEVRYMSGQGNLVLARAEIDAR